MLVEVFTLLIEYLNHPDSDPTVSLYQHHGLFYQINSFVEFHPILKMSLR